MAAEVPELPELTRISSWPRFSPKVSDNGSNLSLRIPASSSSSLEGIIFGGSECPKGSDCTAPTTEVTQQSDLTSDDPMAVPSGINSSLVSGSPFDASLSAIFSPTAEEDACDDDKDHPVETIDLPITADISTEFLREASSDVIDEAIKMVGSDRSVPAVSSNAISSLLPKDFTPDDGNAAGEELRGAPRLQESDDLSSLGASYESLETAISDDSDDSITYMMRYCRCIESRSEAAVEEGDVATAEETEGADDSEAGHKSFNPDLSLCRGRVKTTGRGASKQPPPFTSVDVLDIVTSPQEQAKKENRDEKMKWGKFTSFDVIGILFGGCIGCGRAGES
jgi:hypothetical protein